ncbi:MAG: hypothetical protein O7D30_09480 [Rickettsia endosymbiont of Ixodes persulcatus]|nr:hypothetical protein [Rickettsia endosymbiont of Ixodes persulcatus]
MLEHYDRTIQNYFDKGNSERVPSSKYGTTIIYYVLYHTVIRKKAVTTKIRVGFGASSHLADNPSLNSVLDKGFIIENDVLQLLLKFRCSPMVKIADAHRVFLQIVIRPQHRDALRFLWVYQLPRKEKKHAECGGMAHDTSPSPDFFQPISAGSNSTPSLYFNKATVS